MLAKNKKKNSTQPLPAMTWDFSPKPHCNFVQRYPSVL